MVLLTFADPQADMPDPTIRDNHVPNGSASSHCLAVSPFIGDSQTTIKYIRREHPSRGND